MNFKRIISVAIAAVMAAASLPVITSAYVDVIPEPVVEFDFEESTLSDITGATFAGSGASLVSDNGSQVLYLNGTTGTYMELDAPKNEGTVLEEYTVSFDVKNQTTGYYFTFYIGDGSSGGTGNNYFGIKAADGVLVSTYNKTAEKKTTLAASGVQNNWAHFDIVMSDGTADVYLNGAFLGSMAGYTMREISASVIRFGFSAWSADAYAKAYYDNIKIYDEALSYEAITGGGQEYRPDEPLTDKLLFAMNFNNRDMTAIAGKAALNGSVAYERSDDGSFAARFSGSANNYISLTNNDGTPLLKDKDEVTIMLRKKADAATSWWFYASPNDSAQTYGKEHYLGLLDTGSKLTSERYNNNGTRNDSPTYTYAQGAWQEVALVITRDKTTIFVDGKAVSEKLYNFTLSEMLGDNPVTYIGRANWDKGEWATGVIDDIAIFDFAPEFDLGDLSNVRSDITLPNPTEENDGYTVTWSTSDANVIAADGRVTIPATGKTTATLTATVAFGNHTLTKNYNVTVKANDYYDYELKVTDEKGVDIQDGMYGLFFEDINYAADGGLYAEMIENRSFEALENTGKANTTLDGLYGWSAYPSGGTLTLASSGGLNNNNTHYLTFTATAANQGFKNQAYEGVYVEAGKSYNVSVWAKAGTYTGAVNAKVYSNGAAVGEVKLTDSLTSGWTKYEGVLTPSKTARHADFVIEVEGAGTASFDMVSCIPDDAVLGVFRKDLADKLKAINPGFLRFPGGCVVEGYNLANRYNWKDSIGAVEERKQNWNRWSTHNLPAGLPDNGYKHYNQTYGLGFYEYFLLCEYMGAKAVPVVNVGLGCQYQSSDTVPVFESDGVTYTAAFQQYIDDALDLIEFANGDATTPYGSIRAMMGHPEPFNLEIMGVGNEQWQTSTNQWFTRYEAFETAIHEKYPDMKLIGTTGPEVQESKYDAAWSWIRGKAASKPNFVYAVDEHYYRTPDWFYENINFYDNYPRNVKVFAGEYASRRTNTDNAPGANPWEAALSEASYLTMVERNADVVVMASYAPLFARLNYTQWSPDMIWFDDADSYVTPTYHVQSMYSNNSGDYTLKSEGSSEADGVYQSVSYDVETGDIIIKIANSRDYTKRAKFTFDDSFKLSGTAEVIQISGSATDVNTMDNQENVAPVTSQVDVSKDMEYELVPMSFTVIRVHTDREIVEKDIIEIDSFEVSGGKADYSLTANGDASEYDIYAAVYDERGRLLGVSINKMSGTVDVSSAEKCKLKVMVWDKTTMHPVCGAIE